LQNRPSIVAHPGLTKKMAPVKGPFSTSPPSDGDA
jgi:hypothetical protein